MKGKAFIPLVLGLVVGLFAVKLVIDTVRKSQAGQPVTKTAVVRAKTDVRAFTVITAEDVEQVEVPDVGMIPQNERVGKKEDVVGRVASKAIPMGAPIMQSMLAPKGTSAGISGRIKPGFRAVAVKIDESSMVGYQVQPGDFVDVIVVMDIKTGERKKDTIAEVLLQRVEVGAIGQGIVSPSEEGKGGKSQPAKTATLLVKEEDSPKLHLAATRGKITLSLRGEDEITVENMPSASTMNLLTSLMGLDDEEVDVDTDTDASTQPAPQVPQAMLVADRPEPEQSKPYEVVVRRGSSAGDVLETITFESKNSSNIIGVTRGAAAPPLTLSGPTGLLGPNRQPPGPTQGKLPQMPMPDFSEDVDYTNPPE